MFGKTLSRWSIQRCPWQLRLAAGRGLRRFRSAADSSARAPRSSSGARPGCAAATSARMMLIAGVPAAIT